MIPGMVPVFCRPIVVVFNQRFTFFCYICILYLGFVYDFRFSLCTYMCFGTCRCFLNGGPIILILWITLVVYDIYVELIILSMVDINIILVLDLLSLYLAVWGLSCQGCDTSFIRCFSKSNIDFLYQPIVGHSAHLCFIFSVEGYYYPCIEEGDTIFEGEEDSRKRVPGLLSTLSGF